MYAILLAGGIGRRLWPISTEKRPKFFIKVNDKLNLLQNTFKRVDEIKEIKNIITITGVNYVSRIQDDYAQIQHSRDCLDIIAEPSPKDTAASVAISALYVKESYGSNQLMLITPSDHIILNTISFQKAITKASEIALTGKIVILAIKPTYPEINYGYIKFQENKVLRFVEKPDIINATRYIESKNFLWNSGIFCATAGVVIREMKKHCANILNQSRIILELSYSSIENSYKKTILSSIDWHLMKNISIDYALMEKSKEIAIVPCDIGWHDLGNWNTISKFSDLYKKIFSILKAKNALDKIN